MSALLKTDSASVMYVKLWSLVNCAWSMELETVNFIMRNLSIQKAVFGVIIASKQEIL